MRRSGLLLATVGLLVLLEACTRDVPPEAEPTPMPVGPPVRVLFLQDESVSSFLSRVAPAGQGLELALERVAAEIRVAVEVVARDVGQPGSAIAVVEEAAADEDYVAVVVGPAWRATPEVASLLARAGLPTLSLSALGHTPPTAAGVLWRRAVAPLVAQGEAAAALLSRMPASRRGVCLAGDGQPGMGELLTTIRGLAEGVALEPTTVGEEALPALAGAVEEAGCGVVYWAGGAGAAARLRLLLDTLELRNVLLVGADAVKDEEFLEMAGATGDGTIASCSCADVSLSTRAADQRFIQDYQAEFVSPPGLYAVEGFDVGGMLAAALRTGARTRSEVAAHLQGAEPYRGLGGRYAFGEDGELVDPLGAVRFYRADGGRWLPLKP